jgi:hypothetical protein
MGTLPCSRVWSNRLEPHRFHRQSSNRGSGRNSQAHSPTPLAITTPITMPRTIAPTARRGANQLRVDNPPGGGDGMPANSKPPSVAPRQSICCCPKVVRARPWGRKGSPLRKAKSLPGHRLSRPQRSPSPRKGRVPAVVSLSHPRLKEGRPGTDTGRDYFNGGPAYDQCLLSLGDARLSARESFGD